jgi:hypothetical protein
VGDDVEVGGRVVGVVVAALVELLDETAVDEEEEEEEVEVDVGLGTGPAVGTVALAAPPLNTGSEALDGVLVPDVTVGAVDAEEAGGSAGAADADVLAGPATEDGASTSWTDVFPSATTTRAAADGGRDPVSPTAAASDPDRRPGPSAAPSGTAAGSGSHRAAPAGGADASRTSSDPTATQAVTPRAAAAPTAILLAQRSRAPLPREVPPSTSRRGTRGRAAGVGNWSG